MSGITANDYSGFLIEIKARIRRGQYKALRAANNELLDLYWDIGESIHLKQESLGWGKAVVETLAGDLQIEFPGRNGFSSQNLWLMRQFYCEYRDRTKLQPLVREVSWAKNIVIMALQTQLRNHRPDGSREVVSGLRPRAESLQGWL